MGVPIPFKQIDFGASDANNEARDNRQLLIEGYHDLHGAVDICLTQSPFLVLGRKGAGKTALAQHILLSANEHNARVKLHKLDTLPFKNFPETITTTETWQTSYVAFWRYHIVLQMLEIMKRDIDFDQPQNEELHRVVDALEAAGELPARDLASGIRHSLELPAASARSGQTSFFFDLGDRMASAAAMFRGHRKSILIVDGLDEIYRPTELELQVLVALISAVNSINNLFIDQGSPAKVLVLCRSDLFDRLPGANTAKYRQDRALELDWYQHIREPKRSHLAQLVNMKARVSDPELTDVVSTYFPTKMGGSATLRFLLDHTRHTPRDLLRLMRSIQRFAPNDNSRIQHTDILQGLRTYSEYFADEIRNELSGYGSEPEIQYVLQLLRRNGRVFFTTKDLLNIQEQDNSDIEISALLRRLFDCSGIGLIRRDLSRPGEIRFTFKYRNRHAAFDANSELVVHMGWRRELGLRGTGAKEREDDNIALPSSQAVADVRDSTGPTPRTRVRKRMSPAVIDTEAAKVPSRVRRRATRPAGPPTSDAENRP